ncbi:DUF4199 domain-containing protein [Chitinophaga varians]|uniref:DUF4199 domain-containing protein n=1 Tax=Chitinophaga varians TaxID=2202339 RepID=UPI00165F4855|nr:DUF4199 domain-containing protein [Chitinophaga varians]MBC9910688.1 DUF4199 domain-containing protein [Chitinophaga varians]
MQQSSQVPVKLPPVYGIIIAVICITLTVIFYVTNQYGTLWTGFCTSLVFFLGVMFAIVHYNSRHHHHTSMMSSFAMGFRTTLLATFLVAVFSLVFHFLVVNSGKNYIDQDPFVGDANVISNANTDRQAFWIMFLGNVLFANIAMGVLAAMLAALVFKANQKTTRNQSEENV